MTRYNLKSSLKELTNEQKELIKKIVEKTQRYYKEDSFYLLAKERKKNNSKYSEFLELENIIKIYLKERLYANEKNENIIKGVSKVGEHFVFYKNNENKDYLDNLLDGLIDLNSIGIKLSTQHITNIEKKIQNENCGNKNRENKYLERELNGVDSLLLLDKFKFGITHFIRLRDHFHRQRGNLKGIKWKKSIMNNIDYSLWKEWFEDINFSAKESLELFFIYKKKAEELNIALSDLKERINLTKDLDYAIDCYFDLIDILTHKYELTKKEEFLNKSLELEKKCLSLMTLLKNNYKEVDYHYYQMHYNIGKLFIKKRIRTNNKKEKEKFNSFALDHYLNAYDYLKENAAFFDSKKLKEINHKIKKCKSFRKKDKNRYKKTTEDINIIKIYRKHKPRKRKTRKNRIKLINMY